MRDIGMGRGASRLAADEPLRRDLESAGWRVSKEEIEGTDDSLAEIARSIELIRRLRSRVRAAVDDGAFPLVLAGNCNSCLGTVAGIGAEELGVIWFDAHADFDDPEENTSGFFDVMGLAMLTGRGWHGLRATIPGHVPIPEQNVVLAAVRDLEPYQHQRVARSELLVVPGAIDDDGFEDALRQLSSHVTRVYLHVDLDSIDVSDAHANEYAAVGGPGRERISQCVGAICRRFDVAAAAITAYDPSFDEDNRTLRAARRVAGDIARGVRRDMNG